MWKFDKGAANVSGAKLLTKARIEFEYGAECDLAVERRGRLVMSQQLGSPRRAAAALTSDDIEDHDHIAYASSE
jgi:hypothetical protein